MKLVEFQVSKVAFLPYNPNRASQQQLDGLEASHQDFGVLQPIVVNRRGSGWKKGERGDFVVGGEHRLRVARKRGMKTYPGVLVSVGPDEERVMNLALNNAGSYDARALAMVLKDLDVAQAKLAPTGFSKAEIDALLAKLEADLKAPSEFADVTVEPGHRCPKCGFQWKGACRS